LALLEIREPVRDLGDVVLSDANRAVVEDVLLEQGRAELLATYGLRPVTKLLLCGPPGCGKTLTAEVLATELGLELALVRTDAAVSSYLGETAANLRRVFDFIEAGRYVVLFDEFDAIGKEREDPSEHGELKRVVNAFLQMSDGYRGRSVVIAATNHERMLDSALWRRFDEVMSLEPPTLDQVRKLLSIKLRAVRSDLPLSDRSFVKLFAGMTHAEIERIVLRAIKGMVLRGSEFVTLRVEGIEPEDLEAIGGVQAVSQEGKQVVVLFADQQGLTEFKHPVWVGRRWRSGLLGRQPLRSGQPTE